MSGQVIVSELMETSGVKFGTSGARGLVTDMTDLICYAYTTGFIQYLESVGELSEKGGRIVFAGDLRSSTDRIMATVAKAIHDRGYTPVNCGKVPSPAVALYGLIYKVPAIMVTGSHIPDDRNGIKYNKTTGEVLKSDETGMKAQEFTLPDIFDDKGMLKDAFPLTAVEPKAAELYIQRWLTAFPSDFLKGKKIGLYEHSAVGREMLYEIFTGLGAEVTKLGFSNTFLPVDTEAIRPEDVDLARSWAKEYGFDAIISTDGDSDRPLISDETGKWLRGDVAGILGGLFYSADIVVTPVSCNTAVEKCGAFKQVRRTRIGSPYVIVEMMKAVADGGQCVVGYEANGGFLTASPIKTTTGELSALPTRDPIIVQLGILGLSVEKNAPISKLLADLPERITYSDRLQDFSSDVSNQKIKELTAGVPDSITALFPQFGAVKDTDTTDGLRITFDSYDVVHLRPSGNAPELRCYTESKTEEKAKEINRTVLEIISSWRN